MALRILNAEKSGHGFRHFEEYRFSPLAILPPVIRREVLVWRRDHAQRDLRLERAFNEAARAPGVKITGHGNEALDAAALQFRSKLLHFVFRGAGAKAQDLEPVPRITVSHGVLNL